ncbi:hypothetical protein GCM10023190_22610 [Enteractinococcus fodinae]|uniref:Glucose/arabinose dehydrogenase n=1 Tax=Enteractinococcus fodinae TaxID=684663 RepID=A0ABU2B3L0_9MICC|nr:PQQ-dependent sugar dehydrogenase [Enteractinococcus fodinae]MDR7347981.1 glucose/arabinose dehydrogenase [Enteractinococcus fodinae]
MRRLPFYNYGQPESLARAKDGPMHSSEFGEATWDALNIIEPGGNYGWQSV